MSRNDQNKTNQLAYGFKSNFVRKGTGFIDTVSPTIQHDLTPGQKVTGLNVPLQSFGNSVIDDMHRDLFWAIYLANSNLKEIAPEGRESVRGLLEWVLSDPNFKGNMMSMCNLKVSSASAAYVLVEQLLQMPEVSQSMSGFGKAEDMEDQADDLDQQAQDQMDGDGEGEDGEQGEDGPENQSGNDQDSQDEGDPNQDPSEDDSDEQGGSGSDSEDWDEEEDEDDGEGNAPWGTDEDEQGELQPETTPEQKQAQADKLRQQAQDIRAKAEQMLDELTGNETKAGQFGRAGAVKTGADFGDNVAGFLSSWGIDEGKGLMLSPEQILEIMKAFSSTGIAALTALIGRIYGVASETLRGRAPVQVVAEDAGYTKDILSMHPAERYKLTVGYPGRNQAIEDWLKRGLGGITKTMQSVREGNFICFVDGSGSMDREEKGGTREQIAKALALGLSKAAIENGQEILLATFGSENELTDLVDNRTSFEKRLEWATFMFDGGPLRLDQRVATPSGWMEIGNAMVGDYVFGVDGKPALITGVYPQGLLDLKRVTFSDGASVVCDLSHLWTVTEQSSAHKTPMTLRLHEIQRRGLRYGSSNWRFRIPITEAIELPEKDFVIDPYLMGTLLGDGSFVGGSPNISSSEGEYPWADVLPEGVIVSDNWEKREGMCPVFGLTTGSRGGYYKNNLNPVTEELKKLNLWKVSAPDKFIPDEYLWASKSQRWSLLQGICDTDGYAKANGGVEVSTISEKLALGIVQLVQSLGGLATVQSRNTRENEQMLWRVEIQINGADAPFRLSRKVAMWKPRTRPITRSIVSIEDESIDEAICIKVDREDGLFLTEGMVVTHNTDFDFALEKMMDLIDSSDEQERFRTDLVIITDGEAGVYETTKERLLQLKDQYGVRLFCLMIGESRYTRYDDIIEVSDKILKFDNVDHVAQVLSESLWV